MEFSRQEYWSGLPFPTPGDLSNPEIKPASLASPLWQANSWPRSPPGKPFTCINMDNITSLVKLAWEVNVGIYKVFEISTQNTGVTVMASLAYIFHFLSITPMIPIGNHMPYPIQVTGLASHCFCQESNASSVTSYYTCSFPLTR